MPKYFLILLCYVLWSCNDKESVPATFELHEEGRTGISFSNKLEIDIKLNIFNYMYYYNGGGLAAGDLNNDDLIDLIFTSNLGKEEIYLNKGDLHFEKIESNVDGGPNSWTNGVSLVDINGDELLDIYLSQVGSYRNLDCTNKLFVCTGIEGGVPLYAEKAAEFGVDFKGFSTQAGFFDYDLDGDLDIYLMNHSLHHNGTFGQRNSFINKVDSISGDKLLRNDNGSFVDVTEGSGILSTVIGYGLGLAFGDVNKDGYPDIYVGNDFHENDYLYINQGDGTFEEELTQQIKHTSRFSMGVDIADLNNDGWDDIISLDMLPEDPVILKKSEGEDALDIFNFKLGYGYNHQYARNNLQLNQQTNSFLEVGAFAGVHDTDWSWTPLLADFDMDGTKDLFISNGIPKRMNDIDYINYITSGKDIQYHIQFDHLEQTDLEALEQIPEIKLKNKFFKGSADLRFSDMKHTIRNNKISYSNSAIYADLDNDGDYDIVTNNIEDNAFIYENLSTEQSIKLILKGNTENTYNIGAQIEVSYENGNVLHFNNYSTRGFQSSHIGPVLLPATGARHIKIIWPDGNVTEQEIIDARTGNIEINQKDAQPYDSVVEDNSTIDVQDLSKELNVHRYHKENPFVEFNREPLIPFSTSTDGPALAIADINGDGLEDFYIGSSKRNLSQYYLQNADGSYSMEELIGAQSDSIYEEVDAIFVDVDNDTDMDLIVATGGNEYRLNSEFTRPLLYINQDGSLKRDLGAFKNIHLTSAAIVHADINKDGFQDIFIGARAVPRSYGKIPSSFVLINDTKGHFINDTTWLENRELGYVKDAEIADIDGDGDVDILLALEWGSPSYLENQGERFELKHLVDASGWWNSINSLDVDNDGDLDIICGNLGMNSRLAASIDEPVRMYYNDFDGNGVKEQVLTSYLDGRELPFSSILELQKQIPELKKRFIYANDFANASVVELLSKEKINSSIIYEATEFKHLLLINQGNGSFLSEPLPIESQFTQINKCLARDLDDDGYEDVLIGGNYYDCNVQMGRYDAYNGGVLLNKSGRLTYERFDEPVLSGQTRNLGITMNNSHGELIIGAQNSDSLRLFKIDVLETE